MTGFMTPPWQLHTFHIQDVTKIDVGQGHDGGQRAQEPPMGNSFFCCCACASQS